MRSSTTQTVTLIGCENVALQSAAVTHSSDAGAPQHAEVIVNADDWGAERVTTNRTLDCFLAGAISSVSAMVFMADSERAAELAHQYGIDGGLHLNFTGKFTARSSLRTSEHQQKIAASLTSGRFSTVFYHPQLASSFEYVVKAQIEEYERLFGVSPTRFDGHHHMHLCANVLAQKLIPAGSVVRRNLSFPPGEKPLVNRLYRRLIDARLARRHRIADYFFDLHSMEPARLRWILEQSKSFNVEFETHPIRETEYKFLMNGKLQSCRHDVRIARGHVLRSFDEAGSKERLI